tara:strand:- start:530 stop:712 length:183 start_codon:yes stop_codon:yes gene_type:complete
MVVYLLWLLSVILWNFGFPDAKPISDVIAAIALGFCSSKLNKIIKDPAILMKNKYFGNNK